MSCPDWSEPVWQCVLLALADAAPALGGGVLGRAAEKGMRAAPLPRCTVTCVVAVVTLQCVLGVPAANPLCGCGARRSNFERCPYPLACAFRLPLFFFNLKVFIK